jgi:hypothetical protein
MSDRSTNLSLPWLAPGQAQKHVTVNESLRRLDAIVQLAVASATTTAEPGSPSDGEVYIVPSGKTGTHWASFTNWALAYYRDGAWEQITPREGWRAYVKDTDLELAYDGSTWSQLFVSRLGDTMTGKLTFALGGAAMVNPAATAFMEVARDGGTRIDLETSLGSIVWQASSCRGTLAAPAALGAGDFITVLPQARGHDGSAWSGSQAGSAYRAINAWSGSDHSCEFVVFSTPPGSTAQVESMLVGDGVKIGAPTGGYPGAGKLNAAGLQVNGADVFHAGASALPASDNSLDLGSGALRFRTVYAATGAINTSDAREKTPLRPLADAERRAIRRVLASVGLFQWREAVTRKGADAARLHAGVTAQAVAEAFAAEGLDASRYALWCADPSAKGERLGVRYDQLFAMALAVLGVSAAA